MLTRVNKEERVKNLKKDIESSRAIFLTNVIGISSNEANIIRREINSSNGKLVVARNTIFSLACKGTVAEKMLTDLKGTNAIALAFDDPPTIAKALNDASKRNENIEFKGGFLGEEELSVQQIKYLASLPSRNEMMAKMFATFNAPIAAFARVLNAIREKKEEQNSKESPLVKEDAVVKEQEDKK